MKWTTTIRATFVLLAMGVCAIALGSLIPNFIVSDAPATTTTQQCAEDDSCWNCATMGNHICGAPTIDELESRITTLEEYRDNLVGGIRQLMTRVDRLELIVVNDQRVINAMIAVLDSPVYYRGIIRQGIDDYMSGGKR